LLIIRRCIECKTLFQALGVIDVPFFKFGCMGVFNAVVFNLWFGDDVCLFITISNELL